MDGQEIDYGGWFIEDLNSHYEELVKKRDRSESYSDRIQLNHLLVRIMTEIQKRNNDYE
tara:strand:+ start:226 stop:402 length:177 start_codon:yes stop_codon:yes gene_type:complete